MQISGDFADVLNYLAMLFAKKRMKKIEISGYNIEYISYRMLGQDMKEGGEIQDFPHVETIDRITCLNLSAKFPGQSPVINITVRWDCYVFEGQVSGEEAEKFIDRIDQSTFRYF